MRRRQDTLEDITKAIECFTRLQDIGFNAPYIKENIAHYKAKYKEKMGREYED